MFDINPQGDRFYMEELERQMSKEYVQKLGSKMPKVSRVTLVAVFLICAIGISLSIVPIT